MHRARRPSSARARKKPQLNFAIAPSTKQSRPSSARRASAADFESCTFRFDRMSMLDPEESRPVPYNHQSDASMYSRNALAKRRALRWNKYITNVIDVFWAILLEMGSPGETKRSTISREVYIQFHLRAGRAICMYLHVYFIGSKGTFFKNSHLSVQMESWTKKLQLRWHYPIGTEIV